MAPADPMVPTGVARERFRRLPPRVANTLIRHGLCSWEQVAQTTDADLLAFEHIGVKALAAIRKEQRLQRV